MGFDREEQIPAKTSSNEGLRRKGRAGSSEHAKKTASLALQPYAKRKGPESIQISGDPQIQAPAIGQTVVYRVNLPVNGTYQWHFIDKNSGFQHQRGVLTQLGRAKNEWSITWSQAGHYEIYCEVLSLPQAREGHPVPFTVKTDVHVSYASSVAHQAVVKAVAKADGATSYENYHDQREREHAEMTGKAASPFTSEKSEASDPFIGAMPINGPVVLEGKSHAQSYVLHYWKGDPDTLKWIVIPRSPDADGQRLIRSAHGASPTFTYTAPGLYDIICTQQVTKQNQNGSTQQEFVPVTATVQAILSANDKAQANDLRNKIAHADTLIAKIAKDKDNLRSRAVAITGVHVAAATNNVEQLPLFIGPSAQNNREFVIVDLRPGVARSEHVGTSPEAALKAFEHFAEKNYPKGSVQLHISANSENIAPQDRSFETKSKIHWDHVGEQIGWLSIGLLLSGLGLMAAGVTAPVGVMMFGAAAFGTAASAAILKGHVDEGATAKQYTIDVMQLAAAFVGFRAFGNLAAYAMQMPNVAKNVIAVEFGLNSGSIGLMSTDVAEELVKVNGDASLSEDERDTRRWQVALNMLVQGGFFWLGYHGAKNDFKITNQVRLVRPDELERQGAAPSNHAIDMDNASSTNQSSQPRGRHNARRWAGQALESAVTSRVEIKSGRFVNDLRLIELRAQGIDWKHLNAEQRLRQSQQLIDKAAAKMIANGYDVTTEVVNGRWVINILSLSGRANTFYRRMQQISPESTPQLRYDPVDMATSGFGVRFDSANNIVELDSAMLGLTDDGFLEYLKHEFRHARQATLKKEGQINSSHGWIRFAEESPRENLSIYSDGFTLDEIRVYSKNQQDTIGDLRRIKKQLQDNPQITSDPMTETKIESVIAQADVNLDSVLSMGNVLEETLDSFQRTRTKITGPGTGFALDPRHSPETWMEPGYSVEGGSGEFVFKDKNNNPLVNVSASVDNQSGPQGMVEVNIPAYRQVGSLQQRVSGEDGMDLINVPMSKSQYEALRNNPGAMLAYVEQHLIESSKKAREWREQIINRQQTVVDPLVKEVKDLMGPKPRYFGGNLEQRNPTQHRPASFASQSPSRVMEGNTAPRVDIDSTNFAGNLVAIERRAKQLDWKHMNPEERLKQSKEIIDRSAVEMTAHGYLVEPDIVGGAWIIKIKRMSGRAETFHRRLGRLFPDSIPEFHYNPVKMAENVGSGGQMDTVTNTVEFDSAMIAMTDDGFLEYLKHELRHGRQGKLRKEGQINSSHGGLIFATEAPRRDLGIYDADFAIEEILIYSKQQHDTVNDLRRVKRRMASDPAFMANPRKVASLRALLSQTDTNYYSVVNMKRALEETLETLQSIKSSMDTTAAKNSSGEFVFKDKGRKDDILTVTSFVHEKHGPDGLIGVTIPAFRRQRRISGEDGMDLITVPTNNADYSSLSEDPIGMINHVEAHLIDSLRRARELAAEIGNLQTTVVEPLVDEIKTLATKYSSP